MQLKDYYSTLEIGPAASTLQVKKSFRRLALQYHPDKNPGNAAAEARFREIQEAYEVLSDTAKREEYNYKRWYTRSLKKAYAYGPPDPASILAECTRLYEYMLTANVFRVDYDALSQHIRLLLSDANIAILQQSTDTTVPEKVIEKIVPAAAALPNKYIEPIASLLLQVAGNEQWLIEKVNSFARDHKQKSRWQLYRIPLVLLLTLILCWLIYLIS